MTLVAAALGGAAFLALGWLAARGQADERVARRLAAIVAGAVALTLLVSIARGELLRFAPDASESDDNGPHGLR